MSPLIGLHGLVLFQIMGSRSDDLALWDSLPYRHHSNNNSVEFSSSRGGVFYVGDAGSGSGGKAGVILGVIASFAFFVGLGCYVMRSKRLSYSNVEKC